MVPRDEDDHIAFSRVSKGVVIQLKSSIGPLMYLNLPAQQLLSLSMKSDICSTSIY